MHVKFDLLCSVINTAYTHEKSSCEYLIVIKNSQQVTFNFVYNTVTHQLVIILLLLIIRLIIRHFLRDLCSQSRVFISQCHMIHIDNTVQPKETI